MSSSISTVSGCNTVVNMLASSAIDTSFKPWSFQTKDLRWVFVASLLGTQH